MGMKKIFLFVLIGPLLLMSNLLWSQEATLDIRMDDQLREVIEVKKSVNKNAFTSGQYTIQLYYGGYDQAVLVMNDFNQKFPQYRSSLFFETPNYKVRVGKYTSRLEATENLLLIKKQFPAAFLLIP
jgi:hypothetical protein